MEKPPNNQLPDSTSNSEIDESMLEMGEFIAQMADVEGYVYDPEMLTAMQLEKVDMSLPIQIDLQVNNDGSVKLGGSPPLYYAETSILPVFHQLKINIQLNKNDE